MIKKTEGIRDQIESEKYGHFPNFENIRSCIYQLGELAEIDGIKKCNMSLVTLPMYGVKSNKGQYVATMEALVDCRQEELIFLNHEIGIYEEVK